jgi:protein BCP1
LQETLDVDFSFFDPQPQDYAGIHTLLRQLFSHDATDVDISGLTDLVLEHKLVGSTVKTGESTEDPYGVLTVLGLDDAKPAMKQLRDYILERASTNEGLHRLLTSEENTIGLVLSSRLVNMPAQIVPPMLKMLEEEVQWAIDEVRLEHVILLSIYLTKCLAERALPIYTPPLPFPDIP